MVYSTDRKLKVFHGLVNYGTQAGLFAKELRKQGIEAISVVYYDPSKRQTDVELLYGGSFLLRVIKHALNKIRLIYYFFKYNTFHFYFGKTLFRNQMDLPFYKLFRKKVIMEYLGNDIRNYDFLTKRYNLPQDHDFVKKRTSHDFVTLRRINFEKKYIDYKLGCLPKYMHFAKLYNYEINEILPLAIDLRNIPFIQSEIILNDFPVKILHAPTKRSFKGTVYIEQAISQLRGEGYNVTLKIIEGITHAQLYDEYKKCDVFIDQISTGWFGTSAIEAMAFGKPTCAYYDELYFQYIDYAHEIPVININRENIIDKLKELLNSREKLPEIGKKSREFVEKYHDLKNVTKKLVDIYHSKVWSDE